MRAYIMFLIENYTCIFTNCDSATQCIVFSNNDDIIKLALLNADWRVYGTILPRLSTFSQNTKKTNSNPTCKSRPAIFHSLFEEVR